jgi:DNA-binding HxlR family transcriptional regulator
VRREVDPRVEALVNEVMGRVADKWTMLVLEELEACATEAQKTAFRRPPCGKSHMP